MKSLVVVFVAGLCSASAATISSTGDLRNDANVTPCGTGCTLGLSSSDSDYAPWAAVVDAFTASATSTVRAVTFS